MRRSPPSACPERLRGHARIDARSLALSRLVADRLQVQPELLRVAKENLANWRQTGSPNAQPTLAEWQAVVDAGLDAVLGVLRGEDERSVRLRQSTPFAGEEIVTRAERNVLIQQYSP